MPKNGVFGDIQHVPKVGTQFTGGINTNLVSTPNHQVDAFASHTMMVDNNFKRLGHGSSTAGVNYAHVQGATVGVSGTHLPGLPVQGSASTSVPLYTSADNRTNFNAYSQSNFAKGMKPNHTVGVRFQHNF